METTSSTMVTKLTKKLTKKKKRELCSKEDGNFKNHGIKQRACEGSLNVIFMFALDSISKHNKGTMFQMSREYIYPPISFIQI